MHVQTNRFKHPFARISKRSSIGQNLYDRVLQAQARFVAPSFCDISGDTGKKPLAVLEELAERNFEENFFALFCETRHFEGLPGNTISSSFDISFQSRAMQM